MKKKNNIGLFYKGLAVFAVIGGITTLEYCYDKTSKAVVWTKDALVRGYNSKLEHDGTKLYLESEIIALKFASAKSEDILRKKIEKLEVELEKKPDKPSKISSFPYYEMRVTNIMFTNFPMFEYKTR